MEEVILNGFICNAVFQKYQDGGATAIKLVSAVSSGDVFEGEPIATATVNINGFLLLSDEVLIKEYSENQGMVSALKAAGIIKSVEWFDFDGYGFRAKSEGPGALGRCTLSDEAVEASKAA